MEEEIDLADHLLFADFDALPTRLAGLCFKADE
jgi:hypothetical protein